MQGADTQLDPLTGPVRDWFASTFPQGPTPAQRLAWPSIAQGENLLLISPTGTGKTLAAFLAILNRLCDEHASGSLKPALQCVYISPLRSLGRDVDRNLRQPLEGIRSRLDLAESPIKVAVRSGDTTAHARRKMRDTPPHLLITTPESLSLLLSQAAWREQWKSVRHIIIDEVHSLVSTKRGTDLAISLERLSALSEQESARVGLSATCRPPELVARYLVGPTRSCTIAEAPPPDSALTTEILVESLLRSDEEPHRGLTYRRLLRRLGQLIKSNTTTLVFANTRAFTEKVTHDLRLAHPDTSEQIAAHHGSLDAERRHEVERALKAGEMHAVVTSTSLELGVDIGQADLSVLVGLPGSTSRCLQRVGRAGHRPDTLTRGILLAATPAELFGAIVTARSAREGRIEPTRMVENALDVLCQQLIAMACLGEWSCDRAFEIIKRSGPMAELTRANFDACLDFLAGDLASPPGAYEPSTGATPRWTSPRIWRSQGHFGIRSRRTIRWFWSNVGTIVSEESMSVFVDAKPVGRLEAAYADRLQPGDRFVLDGRSLVCKRNDCQTIFAVPSAGEPELPRWSSDRQGLSVQLAQELARFRYQTAQLLREGTSALRSWLDEEYAIDGESASLIEALIQAQEARSEVPAPDVLLVEESPDPETGAPCLTFHAPLGRPACEALGRAVCARLGRQFGRNLVLSVADLGWSIRLPEEVCFDSSCLPSLLELRDLGPDVIEGLDRGELLALRFRHVAATALMVLRNPEGGRMKVGGLLWVSKRLFPLVQAACPDHPLLKETRREVLEDLLDLRSASDWLASSPTIRYRKLDDPSPFASVWIDLSTSEPLAFEAPADALKRLHARLVGQPTNER